MVLPVLAGATAGGEFDIILLEENRTARARVAGQVAACTDESPPPGESFYRLASGEFGSGYLGIAVLMDAAPVLQGARTDLDQDGELESYRSCTSVEGLHLTVWAGEPLKSRRLWHYYHYVGYDMEPTCTEADYKS